jgi:phosphatidylglycerophosphatase C
MSAAPVVAAFDVDGTLTTRDCVVPFLRRLSGRRGIVAALLRQPLRSVAAVVRRDRDTLKEVVVGGVYRGRSVTAVNAEGRRFAAHVAAHWMRGDTLARLRWHQANGHRTVLVSASMINYLASLAELLEIDAVLATEVVAGSDQFGGELLGGNCRAEMKRERLSSWMAEQGIVNAQVWAYGDSRGDREMLAMAARPHLVRNMQLSPTPEAGQ